MTRHHHPSHAHQQLSATPHPMTLSYWIASMRLGVGVGIMLWCIIVTPCLLTLALWGGTKACLWVGRGVGWGFIKRKFFPLKNFPLQIARNLLDPL